MTVFRPRKRIARLERDTTLKNRVQRQFSAIFPPRERQLEFSLPPPRADPESGSRYRVGGWASLSAKWALISIEYGSSFAGCIRLEG